MTIAPVHAVEPGTWSIGEPRLLAGSSHTAPASPGHSTCRSTGGCRRSPCTSSWS